MTSSSHGWMWRGRILAGVLLAFGGGDAGRALADPAVTLTETGSTLMLPLWQEWAAAYGKVASGVGLQTAGTGSGAGIAAAIDGRADIGASDAYMSDAEADAHPGVLDIALAISAQIVAVHLPGLQAPLRLTGPVLAGIYAGRVRSWDDKAIASINPGVALPHQAIVPIRRADGSGDTFIFTQFLTFSTPDWENGPGYGLTVSWPKVDGERTVSGNAAMVAALQATPGGIGYVGGSYADAAAQAGLATVALGNEAGRFVMPTQANVTAAADALTPRTPADERLTLAFAPGENSYPLVNYEYAVVRARGASDAQAEALRALLVWAVTPGEGGDEALLSRVHFIALPTGVRALSEAQIARIH